MRGNPCSTDAPEFPERGGAPRERAPSAPVRSGESAHVTGPGPIGCGPPGTRTLPAGLKGLDRMFHGCTHAALPTRRETWVLVGLARVIMQALRLRDRARSDLWSLHRRKIKVIDVEGRYAEVKKHREWLGRPAGPHLAHAEGYPSPPLSAAQTAISSAWRSLAKTRGVRSGIHCSLTETVTERRTSRVATAN
jgi:hypothetical protein